MTAGIDAISFYSSPYFLDLRTMAAKYDKPAAYFHETIGQEQMAVSSPDEDVVTLGANAAVHALEDVDPDTIEALILATESGVDQSKAAGIFIHGLLDLPSTCRTVEMKQACYSGTAGLRFAWLLAQQNPGRKYLVIAADIARYGLGTPGEPTQGCGAVAMVVSAKPRLFVLEPQAAFHTDDVMDFWRPNYRDEALVDGGYSTRVYLKSLLTTWQRYGELTGLTYADFDRFCYHLPFSRIAEQAHRRLVKASATGAAPAEEFERRVDESVRYNRQSGNSYAASLYVALCSLLDNSADDLSGGRVGMFSYGSGCTAEYFSGIVQPGYRDHLQAARHREMLASREELAYDRYAEFYNHALPTDGSDYTCPQHATGRFRLAAVRDHKRVYEPTA